MIKPLILSPAGSFKALCAAVNGGADEVYFGAKNFNARYSAENFTDEEFKEAIKMCRILGVRTNITVNTLVTDREMRDVCDMVYNAACDGADAFIVQDLGLAMLLHRQMPSVELHASTQCACHSLEGAKKLTEYGFSRIVLAREMPFDEIKKICDFGIETEIFMHGALCVCHSGMCLMSSVIGKRSGNRGMCAQPCRLPYSLDTAQNNNGYPLSLKDLSLSRDVEKLSELGVSSLKIEGRMKSPEYVYGVTKLWRKLIDEGASANKDEIREFEALFSRGGFTDKYFTGQYKSDNSTMYGVRSDEDKRKTDEAQKNTEEMTPKKRQIDILCRVSENSNAYISADCDGKTVEYTSDFVCSTAKNAPVTEDEIRSGLSKLGTTYFDAKNIDVSLSGNVFLSKSMLNSLRREVVLKLENVLAGQNSFERSADYSLPDDKKKNSDKVSFEKEFFDVPLDVRRKVGVGTAVISLECFDENNSLLDAFFDSGVYFGVRLPRVIYSSEWEKVTELLERAKNRGARFAEVNNIGMIDNVKKSGLALHGGIGLNVYNSYTLEKLASEGFEQITLSPELNIPQMRDMVKPKNVKISAFVKGRLPLMVLESCIIRANGACKGCNRKMCGTLHDRKGYDFPIYGERRMNDTGYPCRNIIVNSVEADLVSKREELQNAGIDVFVVFD